MSIQTYKNINILFDLETTGIGKREQIRIVQIACIACDQNWNSIAVFQALVNPTTRIPKAASKVHGISNKHVANKPTFSVVGQRLLKWLKQWTQQQLRLVGFNSKSYDSRILVYEMDRYELNLPTNVWHVDCRMPFCKLTLQKLKRKRLQDYYIAETGQKAIPNQHTAFGDIKAMLDIIHIYKRTNRLNAFNKLLDKLQEPFSEIVKRTLHS